MIPSLFVLLENDKTLYTVYLCIAIMAYIVSSHGKKPKVAYARSKKLLRDLVVENSSFHWDGRSACPTGMVAESASNSVLSRNSRFTPVGRRNQNLFISCSIIVLKIQTCKVTYIKPEIPYAQHIPEHQTHESLQLYS